MPIKPLPVEKLRHRCDPKSLPFETTADITTTSGIIGQPRGVRAIEFGISIQSHGYNIYVLGDTGTGKTTAIRRYLEERTRNEPRPDDWVYVHNFTVPHQPRAIEFPAGHGTQFKKQMEQLVASLRDEMPKAFSTEEYEEEVDMLARRLELKQNLLMRDIERKAEKKGFGIIKTAAGLTVTPVANGDVMTHEQFAELTIDEQRQIDQGQIELENQLEETMKKVRQIKLDARGDVETLDRRVAERAIAHHVEALTMMYADHEEVLLYLSEVHDDVLDNLQDFRQNDGAKSKTNGQLRRYEVNMFVENGQTEGAPVYVEQNPSYNHLIGRIEYEMRDGIMSTHFTNIKPGSLHKANGGYLVMDAADVLADSLAWETLKRAIKAGEIVLQPYSTLEGSSVLAKSIDPEPIPLDIKLILLGSPALYYGLYDMEEDFNELFKVKSDFGREMERTPENELAYATFVATRCHTKGLIPFDQGAMARIIEFGSERCGHQKRLSSRFGEVADLMAESAFWAEQKGHDIVSRDDVVCALKERIYRSNKVENLIDEDIEDGSIFITTEGEVVGQINGLSVIDLGDYAFGRPSRITARTFAGSGGIVHIEREVDMADNIHNKGVLTLAGFLGGHYAQEYPLSMTGSLTFEQNYGGVGGDSASSAELYALLSSIAEMPIKQSIAVTGSINQHGAIQPIGGVTEKIEGFYRVCTAKGLTGDQGVLIPQANVNELMLDEEVVTAVENGNFNVWAISSVDEGIELLFGQAAGERDEDGIYPEGSVHRIVQDRLAVFAKRDSGDDDDQDEDENEDETDSADTKSVESS